MSELLLAEAAPSTRAHWRTSGSLIAGGVLVLLVVLAALVSIVWTPYDPTVVRPDDSLAGSSWQHLLGADQYGRDTRQPAHGRRAHHPARRGDRDRHRRAHRHPARR